MANFTADSINITKDLSISNITSEPPLIHMQAENICGFILINYVLLCNLIGLFGLGSNIINAAVFFKQGFGEAITVSLFALSLSDFSQLLMVLLVSNFHIPLLIVRSNLTAFLHRFNLFMCGILRICFSRISIWITVFITLERCVCIIYPLKVRTLFTPTRMSLVIAIISGVILVTSIPIFATVRVVTSVAPETNQTIYGFAVMSLGSSMRDVSVVVTMCIQILSLIIIIVNNVLLLLALKRRKHRWTQERNGVFVLSVDGPSDESPVGHNLAVPSGVITISALNITIAQSRNTARERRNRAGPSSSLAKSAFLRDRKLSRMVIILAVILLMSFLPSTIWFCLTRVRPEFQHSGRHRVLSDVVWSFMYVLEAFNSSINILVYYYMSTRYRETFRRMMGKLWRRRRARVAPVSVLTRTSRLAD